MLKSLIGRIPNLVSGELDFKSLCALKRDAEVQRSVSEEKQEVFFVSIRVKPKTCMKKTKPEDVCCCVLVAEAVGLMLNGTFHEYRQRFC